MDFDGPDRKRNFIIALCAVFVIAPLLIIGIFAAAGGLFESISNPKAPKEEPVASTPSSSTIPPAVSTPEEEDPGVETIPATDIIVNKTDLSLYVDESFKLEVTLMPENTTDKVIFDIDKPEIISLSQYTVTGLKEGKAVITIIANNSVQSSVTVTVKKKASSTTPTPTPSPSEPEPSTPSKPSTPSTPSTPSKPTTPSKPKSIEPTSVKLNKTSATIEVGKTVSLTATILPSNATNKTITWSTSNSTVATIVNGVVTGRSSGTVTITATSHNGKKATATITVTKPVTRIDFNTSSVDIEIDKSYTVTATVQPTDATNKSLVWRSNNSKIATVTNGTIKGIAAGTTTISATAHNGVISSVNVTVRKKADTISTNFDSLTMYDASSSRKLTASAKSGSKISFSSSDKTIATIDADGKISSKKAGTATITVKSAGNSVYNAGQKTIKVIVPSIRGRVAAMEPWRHALIETYYFIYGREYRGSAPGSYSVTVDESKKGTNKYIKTMKTGGTGKNQTCNTLPTVTFKRKGLFAGDNVQSGYVAVIDGTSEVTSAVKSLKKYSKLVTVTYPHKTLKSLVASGDVHYGDIISVTWHNFIYMGTDAHPKRIYESGTNRSIGGGTNVSWGHTADALPVAKTAAIESQIASTKKIMTEWRNGKKADSAFAGHDAGSSLYNGTIHMVVSIKTFTIKTTVENGTITKSNRYMANENVKVSYSPASGKTLDYIEVDGRKITGNKSAYTFKKINANHKIRVVYK
ncbi:Ig-like domain-containing protein [Candidatus Saccharibacteria bacterium]|nr:Ig-like domain-containing protein [Candidatus Saccharibacteria bacterium]